MIKEFMLIVYIVGGGGGNDGYDYSTNFQFQRFSTMEQCDFVKKTAEGMQESWHFNDEEEIPAHYSLNCVELPPGAVLPVTTAVQQPIPVAPIKRQWDWNGTP